MPSTTATAPRKVARPAGAALISAVLTSVIAEAIVAAAWDRRPYSYLEDYVSFLGSRSSVNSRTFSSPHPCGG
jgi:hypothetical protein